MSVVGTLVVKVAADASGFDQGLGDAEARTSSFKDKLSGLRSTLGQVFSVAAIVGFGKAAVDAYAMQEAAVAKVRTGLESMGNVAGKTLDELLKDASALQENSLFGDEEILDKVTSNLLTFGNIAGEAFDKAQQAAVDLAARLGGDLQGAAIMVGKALDDPVRGVTALRRVGASFSEEQEAIIKRFVETNDVASAQAVILDALEKQYGGTAKALAEAGTGPLTQIKMILMDLTEVIGGVIVEAIMPFASGLKSLLDWVKQLPGPMQKVATVLPVVAVAVGGLVLAFGPIPAAIAAVVAGVGLLISNFDKIQAWFTSKFPAASNKFTSIWNNIKKMVVAAIDVLKKAWDDIGPGVEQALRFAGNVIGFWFNYILGLLDFWIGMWADAFDFIAGLFTGDWARVWEAAKSVFQRIWNVIGEILIKGVDFILGKVQSLVEFFDKDWAASIQNLRDRMKDFIPTKDIEADVSAVVGQTERFERTAKPNIEAMTGALDPLKPGGDANKALDETATKMKAVADEIGKVDPKPINDTTAAIGGAGGLVPTIDNLRTTTENLPDIDIKVSSATGTAIDNLVGKLTGTGQGTLLGAINTEIAGAVTGLFGIGGIFPGAIGSFIDGALNELIQALITDLVQGTIIDGIGGAFKSIFGAGGQAEVQMTGFAESLAPAGLVGGLVFAAFALTAAKVFSEWAKHWDSFIDTVKKGFRDFGLGGTGGQTNPEEPTPGTLGDTTSVLSQAVRAAIADAIAQGVTYSPEALANFLEGVLPADFWRAFEASFGSRQEMLDWLGEFLPGAAGARAMGLPSMPAPAAGVPMAAPMARAGRGGGLFGGQTLRIVDSNLGLVMVGVLEG